MTSFRMSKKKRRHSGRVTPRFAVKGKYSELIKDGLEPQEFWDDWVDYRDGFRGDDDRKQLRKISENSFLGRQLNIKKWNRKLKKLIKRRKAIKNKNYKTKTLKTFNLDSYL